MRARNASGGVTLQAIAGNHAVFLGFDLDPAARDGCLGFAVERTDHTEDERYWLSGFKTFQSVVPVPSPTTIYPTRDHPLQTFYWGDYTAKPAHRYTYRAVPRYGSPKNLEDHPGVEVAVDVTTNDPDQGTHGVYFNRGVAASQAYATRFGAPPDALTPDRRALALTWLSRGLFEALLAFIRQADGPGRVLRAAVFEFTQPDVLAAFAAAAKAGADVKIVYHARDDSTGNTNRTAIAAAGLDPAILVPRTHAQLAHNKFIAFGQRAADGTVTPISVWTGSTNLSEGGIFGHSNVGHAVRDAGVAARYLEYWATVAEDPELDALRDWDSEHSPFAADPGPPAGIQTIFSPRHGLDPLRWYANQFATATGSGYLTEPFGMTKEFENALVAHAGDSLHYVMLDKPDQHQATWSANPKVLVAVGASAESGELSRWANETLTGFNPLVPYLHTKILLRDPMSATPTVITGSANFSPNSTDANDENMLFIPDDPEVADVYFTEFARIFNHFYARWWASQLQKAPGDAETRSFLDETPGWQTPYFTDGNPKQLQRTLYGSGVEGNVAAVPAPL